MAICLEQGVNDLNMVQLMPLPSRHFWPHKNLKWLIFLVAWLRNDRASDFRPRGRGFDPQSGRSYVMILGKLFTPTCLNADSLCYYMESLNQVPLPFLSCVCLRRLSWNVVLSCCRVAEELRCSQAD